METENEVMPNEYRHTRDEVNNIDPDDGNSWLCNACNLPIFASPFLRGGGDGRALLHDQCANLPEVLKDCELHPGQELHLQDNNNHTCSICRRKCGSKVYKCGETSESDICDLILDVACALPVKILHRSHKHRLVAVSSSLSSSCGVCGVVHQKAATSAQWSYFCRVCGFWIHPECVALPNVIEHTKHEHPLVLYYHIAAVHGAQYSYLSDPDAPSPSQKPRNLCAICQQDVGTIFGIYSCLDCHDFIIHISCAMSYPLTFKPVSNREARFTSLVRLPMADEDESIVGCIRETKRRSNSDDDHINTTNPPLPYVQSIERMHQYWGRDEHSFILHHDMTTMIKSKSDEDEGQDQLVCDVCVKFIKAPPFYSCSGCPTLFLHDHCYRVPTLLTDNAAHEPAHALVVDLDDDSFAIPCNPICSRCGCRYIQARYKCSRRCYFDLAVCCALTPEVITHDAHNAAHFLLLRRSGFSRGCDCCGGPLEKVAYECDTCPNFALHTWCAMLPRTVKHKFDPHPLQLSNIATNNEMICEICENWIDHKVWYYMCVECDQLFHVNCIPVLGLAYKIKSLARAGKMRNIDIPTRLIRGLTLQGHAHDYCADVADEYDILESDQDSYSIS